MTWIPIKGSNNAPKLPAGEYYIGDPCYALKDEDYDETAINGDGFYTDGENILCIFSTAYGDGCYRDTKGRIYGVDSGTLSVIPRKVCDEVTLGTVVVFKNEFIVGCSGEGKLWVEDPENPDNSFEIPTAGEDSEEDEDDDDEDD
jgi:hypothetical protein